jgi:Tfp pilus assembly protein PilN
MRAVNLLPADLRGAAPKPARSARPEPVEGIGAYLVLGILGLCVAALAGYVLLTNGVKQREADLVAAQQRTTVATAEANRLKPYADFASLANARFETVRDLAAARFDWEQAIRDISRAVPSDVKLSSLNGDLGLSGGGGGGDPLRASIQAPAITLAGCAPTQHGVARMMSRIRAVDGVTRVALSKSVKPETAGSSASPTASACGAAAPPEFSLVVFFERAAALNALQAGGSGGVLVPNALSGGSGTAAKPSTSGGATATPAPQSDSAGTSTTPGSTK